jgi:ADP-heptose:LPS heptosyltransferase
VKILVVQLLRLGDIVLSTPVIKGLRELFPDAQIDFLMNKQFEGIVPLLPPIDQVHFFERELIQTALGESNRFVFEAFDRIENLIDQLKFKEYDRVINLTHNKLSAYLVGALRSSEKVGLWMDDLDQPVIHSPWFQHLNSDDQGDDSECFHLVDIYKAASGIKPSRIGLTLIENEKAKQWVDLKFGLKKIIAVQALTSDPKKNWGVQKYRAAIEMIAEALPQYHFVILGAPFEEKVLRETFDDLESAEVFICDLDVAYSVIKKSEFVITGDTSIKHLAAAAKVRCLEISIGSSDIKKTGLYSELGIIIQSKEECSPCPHFSPCHQSDHFCARRISPEIVSVVIVDSIRNHSMHLKQIAEEFSDQVEIFKPDIMTTGYWSAIPVGISFSESQVATFYHRFAAKLFIEHRSGKKNIFEVFGSESERLATLLKNTFRDAQAKDWKVLLNDLESKSRSLDARLVSLENHFYQYRLADKDSAKSKELLQALLSLRERARLSPALLIQKDQLDRIIDDETPVFVRLRKVQQVIHEMKLKSEIELKLIRSLQTQLEV